MSASLTQPAPDENELQLRSGVILSIFMGITLVSAVFFGLGYSFGHTGTQTHSLPTTLTLKNAAPAAMATVDSATTVAPVSTPSASASIAQTQTVAAVVPEMVPAAETATRAVAEPTAVAAAKTVSEKSNAAAPIAHLQYVVQVAAVARRKDALALTAALRRHGLNARLHTASHDRFFHVQIGPFATQQKAEAVRHKVIAAGYKAILKPA